MGSSLGTINFYILTLVTRLKNGNLPLGYFYLYRIKHEFKKILQKKNKHFHHINSLHFTVHLSLSKLESILNMCILLQILSISFLLLYGSHILIFLSLFSEYISTTFH